MNDVFVNNITICKCKNCGKYFIPKGSTRKDVKYCDNPSPQNPNKRCIELGASKMYRNSIKSDAILNEDYLFRQRFLNKIRRSNDTTVKKTLRNKLDTYKKEYSIIYEKYVEKEISEKDVISWIKKQGVSDNGNKGNSKK